MNLKESKRQRLLSLINRYLSQSNIKMKYVLRKYQTKLINGKSLTEKELDSIVPLLEWNMGMNQKQVKEYFCEVTRHIKEKPEVTNTLEEFFV